MKNPLETIKEAFESGIQTTRHNIESGVHFVKRNALPIAFGVDPFTKKITEKTYERAKGEWEGWWDSLSREEKEKYRLYHKYAGAAALSAIPYVGGALSSAAFMAINLEEQEKLKRKMMEYEEAKIERQIEAMNEIAEIEAASAEVGITGGFGITPELQGLLPIIGIFGLIGFMIFKG